MLEQESNFIVTCLAECIAVAEAALMGQATMQHCTSGSWMTLLG